MADFGAGADKSVEIAEQVSVAYENKIPLSISGGGSKIKEGHLIEAEPVSVVEHCGVTEYSPTELVITARAGTPLADIETQLASAGQMLPFEPPHLGLGATIGGTIACAMSGPRRPYAGAARDAVLGVRMINGRGEILKYGGQVMKNVAGYDVSRLMVGAQGTLGIILDVSIKVLPAPEREQTICLEMGEQDAIQFINMWSKKPVPLSAACFLPKSDDETGDVNQKGSLWLRLSGVDSAVTAAASDIGGEVIEQGQKFWTDLRERQLAFFKQESFKQESDEHERNVWRISLPPASPPIEVPGSGFIDWGGALRWLKTQAASEEVYDAAARLGGHAIKYSSNGAVLPPLSSGLMTIHHAVKKAFDPEGILNPGRLYKNL